MSAKWRALQHRHRYTYGSTIFPESFAKTIASLLTSANHASSSRFLSELEKLLSLNTTYSQVASVKEVTSSFCALLNDSAVPEDFVFTATRLFLEILFLENSLPLHRTLISGIVKSRKALNVIGSCFVSLCREYGDRGRKEKQRFLLSRAALSLLGYPKLAFLDATIDKCAILIALDVSDGLMGVISDISLGSRPSPTVMEQCQEAMSCLYYLLQRFPSRFSDEEKSDVFESVMRTTLSVLKSAAFSRDCFVAAGVSFWAALQVLSSQEELTAFISWVFFGFSTEDHRLGKLSMQKLPYHGDLYSDIKYLSVLSRLCLLRGILTAVPRIVLNTHLTETCGKSIWTVLYNGILPELCDFCENPSDRHFNFHALTVTQICFQQIKTSILSDLTNFSEDYNPLPEEITNRILKIIWNNLEDPLSQTVKQVHLIFDLFLDIKTNAVIGGSNERVKLFLHQIASDLLRLGSRCKGRYIPLAILTKRLGAKNILEMNPKILEETIHGYVDDDVCCSATSFLKCFLECLRDECWSSDGIEGGYETFRDFCLPPVLHGLVSGHSKLRSNLNTYTLPAVLEVDVDSIFPMLAFISVAPDQQDSKITSTNMTINQCVSALVSLLKVSRSLALIEGDIEWDHGTSIKKDSYNKFALVVIKGVSVKIIVKWLVLALTHSDENIRLDAAESLFLNPKTSSLPSSLELNLIRKSVPLNMRCCSTAFQMKWTSLFRKFFSRVRTALERQKKQRNGWQPMPFSKVSTDIYGEDTSDVVFQRAQDLYVFMQWLSCHLFFSCYPSAPYERKTMAMELILIMIDVWPIELCPQGDSYLHPYSDGFISPGSTLLLVGSVIDSWDNLRESSYRILVSFPTPLPGIATFNAVKELIIWAKILICSPRVRECDAGALALRLIFRKYVLDLGWSISASTNVTCSHQQHGTLSGNFQNAKSKTPVVEYLSSLIDWLRVAVEEGEKDLSNACRNSFVHGVLLTLRYTFEELDWNSTVNLANGFEMKQVLEFLLELIIRITSLALRVVSADAWYLSDDTVDMVDDVDILPEMKTVTDTPESASKNVNEDQEFPGNVGPAAQIVMVGCWLAMKEVSLLLGTIIRKIPLPSCNSVNSPESDPSVRESASLGMSVISDTTLDFKQLEYMGDHFLQVLLKMKHNGAIDKTRAGFTALCNRLLSSNDPRLCKMTENWMDLLMERTVAKGQTVDDLLRRSAGIPAAFLALFLSEPEGTPKKLLPRALRWLIDVAKKFMPNSSETGFQNDAKSGKNLFEISHQENNYCVVMPGNALESVSKSRDEGLVPTVHAFNVLKAAFNDTNLAADTSGFSAEALVISIRSFSSPYWEVRNGACLAYTALIRRMIGFLNVHKRESVRRALTGLEFFHRFPALHPFLFSELKIATESLADGYCEKTGSNIAKAIHPSLCPILILLSRLKPSFVSSDPNDAFDPFVFMPFIKKCATQNNLRVRVLASKALTGLVSNERLCSVIISVANGLHYERDQVVIPLNSCSISVGELKVKTEEVKVNPCFATFNSIHGMLLQLSTLIDVNCRSLTDILKTEEILFKLIQLLIKCSWIGRAELCPCPTLNCSFLQVLDHMLDVARTCKLRGCATMIQTLLIELSLECLDRKNSCGQVMYDPTEVELCKQAAASYFRCLSTVNPESQECSNPRTCVPRTSELCKMPQAKYGVNHLQEKILQCLYDPTYEVRVATLKWLLHFLKCTNIGDYNGIVLLWCRTNLLPTLMQLLTVEVNRKCIYYILRVIFYWNLLQVDKPATSRCKEFVFVATMDYDSVICFWNRLLELNNVVTNSKTQEALMRCMGICTRQFTCFLRTCLSFSGSQVKEKHVANCTKTASCKSWTNIYRSISYFVHLIKKHSAPSEPVNMREAAAESLMASGLLEDTDFVALHVNNDEILFAEENAYELDEYGDFVNSSKAVNLYACRVLDIWSICIQLLEDEDVQIRQKLAKNVQSYLSSKDSSHTHSSDSVPTQIERVIESSFEFLSSTFQHWFAYFDYLSRWALSTASNIIVHGNLVRQVFDKEIDNHHEEKLLICQICCFYLENMLRSPSWAVSNCPNGKEKNDILIFIQKRRLNFLHQLQCFASEFMETVGNADWIGGMGNHKDAFLSIYANLLGFYSLLQIPTGDDYFPTGSFGMCHSLSSDFVKLEETIKPFLRNPLISNLYSLVIMSYEKIVNPCSICSDSKFSTECSVWKNFDPYFLLR